jgi:cell division protein FtsQ
MNPPNRRVAPAPGSSDSQPGPAGAGRDGGRSERLSRLAAALRTGCGALLVVASSLGVAWVARRYVLTSPRFAVRRIVVTGAERRSAQDVVAESGIATGANVFGVDLDDARARVLADPWIAEVSAARRLPGTIVLNVSERKAAALVSLGQTFLATADGEPFKSLGPADPVDLPLITGVPEGSLEADRDGTMQTIRRGIDLAALYEKSPLAARLPLEQVHVDSEGAFRLVVGPAGVELVLGAAPFRRKLDEAARVVAELDRRGARPGAILLDNEVHPERVVVRVR